MGKKKKVNPEDLIIPPQDQKICCTVFICQMVLILSTVSIVYLTVAIYVPSSKAFNSGISETPVMCTTTRLVNTEVCDWGSCGEWCLSKTSGACQQIFVNLRRNGSNIILNNCTSSANKTCYGIDQENAKKARCILDECKNLTGTFNCSAGSCINITDAFDCAFHNTDPPLKCSGRRGKITCIDIQGLFSCTRGSCRRIRSPYNCDRRCLDIPTRNKNAIILSGDKVYLSTCASASNSNTTKEVWNESQENVLMASCYRIQNTSVGIEAVDCINGSTLEKNALTDFTNFTHLNNLHLLVSKPNREIAPPDYDLTISNHSRLMINLEGCVNTLMDECNKFIKEYGKDGTDHNARARFPCFYAENDPETVVARFSLAIVEKHFVVGFFLPVSLMIVSCFTIFVCQRTVVVGDDAKMRFKACGETESILPNERQIGSADGEGIDSAMAL